MIEVVDDTLTGEVLLDEALKMMKASEKMSVSSWIDLMSGTFTLTHSFSHYPHPVLGRQSLLDAPQPRVKC